MLFNWTLILAMIIYAIGVFMARKLILQHESTMLLEASEIQKSIDNMHTDVIKEIKKYEIKNAELNHKLTELTDKNTKSMNELKNRVLNSDFTPCYTVENDLSGLITNLVLGETNVL